MRPPKSPAPRSDSGNRPPSSEIEKRPSATVASANRGVTNRSPWAHISGDNRTLVNSGPLGRNSSIGDGVSRATGEMVNRPSLISTSIGWVLNCPSASLAVMSP